MSIGTTVLQLINILPKSALPSLASPYHALHVEVHDDKHLCVFGCVCFPFLCPYNRFKMQYWSTECVYFGPSPQHKGYKFLSPEGRIYVSKNVVFNEIKFPYPSFFPTTLSPSNTSHESTFFPTSIPIVTSQESSQDSNGSPSSPSPPLNPSSSPNPDPSPILPSPSPAPSPLTNPTPNIDP